MTLVFPTSPSDGDKYPDPAIAGTSQWHWVAATDTWDLLPPEGASGEPAPAVISSPAPTGQYTDADGTWDFWQFDASGSLTVDTGGFADVLVIGGGGAGAPGNGGGGGAGGYLYATEAYLSAGSQTVVVGAGGANGSDPAKPRNGSISRVGDYYSPGGGHGGSNQGYIGQVGASGGGGCGNTPAEPGSGSSPLGNNGGYGGGGAGGGGGGAGSAGVSGGSGGSGGSGVSNSITGSAVTYAAGGSGDSNNNTIVDGPANTGNGGKGVDGTTSTSSNGGSGIVIVRVKV